MVASKETVTPTAASMSSPASTSGGLGISSRLAGASNDVRPAKLGPFDLCIRTSATTEWVDGRLEFYAMGLVHVVTRYIEDGDYKWDYPQFGTTTMERICKLPDGA